MPRKRGPVYEAGKELTEHMLMRHRSQLDMEDMASVRSIPHVMEEWEEGGRSDVMKKALKEGQDTRVRMDKAFRRFDNDRKKR